MCICCSDRGRILASSVGTIDLPMQRVGNGGVLASVGRLRQRQGVSKGEEVQILWRRRTVRRRSMATPPQQILASEADKERRAHSQGRGYQTPQPSGSDVDQGGCLGAIKQFAGATEWRLGVAEMSKFQYKSAENSFSAAHRMSPSNDSAAFPLLNDAPCHKRALGTVESDLRRR